MVHVSLQGVALPEMPRPNSCTGPAFLLGIKVGSGVSLIKWAGQARVTVSRKLIALVPGTVQALSTKNGGWGSLAATQARAMPRIVWPGGEPEGGVL